MSNSDTYIVSNPVEVLNSTRGAMVFLMVSGPMATMSVPTPDLGSVRVSVVLVLNLKVASVAILSSPSCGR